MSIQGSDHLRVAAAGNIAPIPPGRGTRTATVAGKVSDSGPSALPTREALMQSVKKKIKSGYYNSESVLDDISHGFASALNSM
jgi:hypothetical protein